jgi:hypothetical protein
MGADSRTRNELIFLAMIILSLCTLSAGAATITTASDPGSTNDFLDFSLGTKVSSMDSLISGWIDTDMIGTSLGTGSQVIFDGTRSEDRAVFRTAGPVTLTGYRIRLGGELPSGNRGATNLVFEASTNGVDYTILDTVAIPAPHGSIAVSNALNMVSPAQYFRVTLSRYISTSGIRVNELDGFGVETFQDYFYDGFAGSGSATVPGSLASDATTANSKVSDYMMDTGGVNISSGVGNPAPGLNNNQLSTAFHLNLKTVLGATYRVVLQASMWGNAFKPNPTFTLDVSAFDGMDVLAGTALGSDGIDVPNGFKVRNIGFLFVAESTSTTLTFEETMGNNDQIAAWIDNLDIDEDLSTRKFKGMVIVLQ